MKYCGMCDEYHRRGTECPKCGADLEKVPERRLTRQERLQALADSGVDTWEEKRGER